MATLIAAPSQSACAVSYLDRCLIDLQPQAISDRENKSTWMKVAAVVTVVAFTALAVTAFAATGIFMPAYLPVIGLSTLLLAMPAANFTKDFLTASEDSEIDANHIRDIQNHFAELSLKAPHQLQIELQQRGINWLTIRGMNALQPETVSALRPLLARAMHLDKMVQKHLQIKDAYMMQAHQLEAEDPLTNRIQIVEDRQGALEHEDHALQLKIEAAFVNAVLRKGNFNGTLEDIATLSNTTYKERLLGNELIDRNAVNKFLTFKNGSFGSLQFDDVKRLSIPELGQRLVVAMN